MMPSTAVRWLLVGVACWLSAPFVLAGDRVGDAAAQSATGFDGAGYKLLTSQAFLPPDFDQETFDNLWTVWEEPLRSKAEKASPEERRAMAFSRYGFTCAPGDNSGKPQQYIVDADGNWTMTCLACHQGKVAGTSIPGLPNSHFALQSLTDDVRSVKLRMKKRLTRMDLGSAVIPLGTTNGTTNAIVFGVALMANRTPDLRVVPGFPPRMVHHDHDAPPWWHFRKKSRLYSDGFAEKGHRPLMQFMLIPENGPEKFAEWEDAFREIYAWLESLEAPKYPFEIDAALAAKGEVVFNANCADCHGTYGKEETYPNKIVSIEDVNTDPIRLGALTTYHRQGYQASWFAHFGEHKVVADPGGYVAPPLDGIWASAPYLHNGSVPTLWHLMHVNDRPVVWSRSEDGYDQKRVGLEITALESMPPVAANSHQERSHFDTTKFGKSAQGHEFPEALSEEEKQQVLEYLKTL